jgi:hypothetical protein
MIWNVSPLLVGVLGVCGRLHGGCIHLGRLVLQELHIRLVDELGVGLAEVLLCVIAGGEAASMSNNAPWTCVDQRVSKCFIP